MLIWYAATAAVAVWMVFDSPALDYRLILVGSVLPVAEIVLGRPGPLHSLVTAVAVLGVVMAATQNRRLVRRRWLGLPIGMFSYLAFSGTFTDTDAFWWPLTGFGFSDAEPPELARGAISLLLEIVGVGLVLWWIRRVGLDDRRTMAEFRATGQLPRSRGPVVGGSC